MRYSFALRSGSGELVLMVMFFFLLFFFCVSFLSRFSFPTVAFFLRSQRIWDNWGFWVSFIEFPPGWVIDFAALGATYTLVIYEASRVEPCYYTLVIDFAFLIKSKQVEPCQISSSIYLEA
jgi:hypothetical protein